MADEESKMTLREVLFCFKADAQIVLILSGQVNVEIHALREEISYVVSEDVMAGYITGNEPVSDNKIRLYVNV